MTRLAVLMFAVVLALAGIDVVVVRQRDTYKAQRDQQSAELHRVNTTCLVYPDGWAKCPPGAIKIIGTTTTTTTAVRP